LKYDLSLIKVPTYFFIGLSDDYLPTEAIDWLCDSEKSKLTTVQKCYKYGDYGHHTFFYEQQDKL
jgi:hypothetical protein